MLGMLLSVSALPVQESYIPLSEWQPMRGDRFIVDTSNNVGYLVHTSGAHTSFKVVTGQQRFVYYIGRYYNAKTPDKRWSVETIHHKHPSITFGPTGRFLRLYDDGERTAYGIHGHRYADEMLLEEDRYRSMGCVIVNESILDLIETTYKKNGQSLSVETMNQSPLLKTDTNLQQ